MRSPWKVFTIFVALLIGSALVTIQAAKAQSAPERGSARRPQQATGTPEPGMTSPPERVKPGAPEPGLRFLSSEMRFSGKVVKHTPYSAETLTESTQALGNGAKLTRQTNGMTYRDSEGRTRRELSATTAGPFATSGDTQRLIFINDPVAGVFSTISPDNDTARTRTILASDNDVPLNPDVSSENSRTESLGKQMIEGFEAEGTRTTILIPAGRVGNDKPLEIVHERWYSPELQTILLSKHSDPRWGETVYKLLNINRSPPDPSLFLLPAPPAPKGNKARPRR